RATLLRALGLLGCEARRACAPRRIRAGAPAGTGVRRGCARRRLGHDRADRRLRAQAEGSPDKEGAAYRSRRGIGVIAMPKNRAVARAAERPRFRNTVTTIMLILMTVLVVRDILVRRWAAPPAAPDVTRRLP